MKKVIDINYLQKPVLENYLAKNRDNYVVFTDFACMEIYKCNALKNLACKLKIVSQYPEQIIVLKGTREIVSLTLATNKLPQSLVDNIQTTGFLEFCNHLKSACQGDKLLTKEVLQKESLASQYLEGLMQSHQLIVDGIKGFTKSYDHSNLKAFRNSKKLPQGMRKKMTEHIFLLTCNFYKDHPDIQVVPEFDTLKNSYIFRYAVSVYFLALRWIKDGGIDQVSQKKLRNDAVDMSYVTYATYFEGLLSLDKKLNAIYQDTLNYLHYFNSSQQVTEPDRE